MIGRVLVGIIAFILLVAFAGAITLGIHGWRTDDVSQGFVVSTGVGETTANVTLSRDLFNDEVTEVQSISSNISESPFVSSYASATNVLLVAGLAASESHALTVAYYSEVDDTVMQILGPFLAFMIFGGCAGAILFSIWKGKR